MPDYLKGIIIAFIGVLAIIPDSLIIRLSQLDSFVILFYRGIFTFLGYNLLFYIFTPKKQKNFKVFLNEYKKIGYIGVILAIIFTLSNFAFVLSINYTKVGNTLFIIASSPIFSAIFSRIFLKEQVKLYTWISIALVLTCVGLIFSVNISAQTFLGDLLALCVALFLGIIFTISRAYKHINMVPSIILSSVFLSIATFFLSPSLSVTDFQLMLMLLLGFFLTISFFCLIIAPTYISSSEVSLFLVLESIFGTLLVGIYLNEYPNHSTIFFGISITFIIAIHSFLKIKDHKI